MAKKDTAIASPEPYKPPPPSATVPISKKLVGKVSVGDRITLTLRGTVKEARENWNGDGYEITVKGVKVEAADVSDIDRIAGEMAE